MWSMCWTGWLDPWWSQKMTCVAGNKRTPFTAHMELMAFSPVPLKARTARQQETEVEVWRFVRQKRPLKVMVENVFLFLSFGLESNMTPPTPQFHDPFPALKISLQTQTLLIVYPDCGLLDYLMLQTLRQNSTRREKSWWLRFIRFWFCGRGLHHDLKFEGKSWQLLWAAAETLECVSYRSMPSLRHCYTWTLSVGMILMDYRCKPQIQRCTLTS